MPWYTLSATDERPVGLGYILGWRRFNLCADGVLLKSPSAKATWGPGPKKASCKSGWRRQRAGPKERHIAPMFDCSCGMYAYGTHRQLNDLGVVGGEVTAQVRAWGKICLHTEGFRSQYMQVERLFIDRNSNARLQIRKYYGVPVFRPDEIPTYARRALSLEIDRLIIPASEMPTEVLNPYIGGRRNNGSDW